MHDEWMDGREKREKKEGKGERGIPKGRRKERRKDERKRGRDKEGRKVNRPECLVQCKEINEDKRRIINRKF